MQVIHPTYLRIIFHALGSSVNVWLCIVHIYFAEQVMIRDIYLTRAIKQMSSEPWGNTGLKFSSDLNEFDLLFTL